MTPHIPVWFKKELAIIDKRYRIRFNKQYRYWEIEAPHDLNNRVYVTVAIYDRLNHHALTNMRKRKWLGRRLEVDRSPRKRQEWILAQNREAKQKQSQIAREMITEGFHKAYQSQTRKIFS